MKKLFSALLACLMLINCFAFSAFSTEAETEETVKAAWPLGEAHTYRLMNEDGTPAEIGAQPITFEATVAFPTSYLTVATDSETGEAIPGVGGMFFGSLDGRGGSGSFGVYRGVPVLHWQDNGSLTGNGGDDLKFYMNFDDIAPEEIYCGELVHIAIVRDINNEKVTCYINGEKRQTMDMLGEKSSDYQRDDYDTMNRHYMEPVDHTWRESTYVLGGDMRASNNRWFRGGTLYEVAVYSDVRTDAEILSDAKSMGSGNNLITHFDLTDSESQPAEITDEAGKFTAVRDTKWIKSAPEKGDYLYSMAFIGDTQKLVEYEPQNVHYLYDWLIDNKESEKIGYVIGLGDITDDATIEQYDAVVPEIDRLCEAYGSDFVAIRGNHDVNKLSTSQVNAGTYITYDDAFADSDYVATVPVSQRMNENSVVNCYKTVNICGVPYLILVLDVIPTTDMLAWADSVVEAHPNHNVIVATHAYLTFDGTTLDYYDYTSTDYTVDGDTDDNKNNGLEIWEKFVKKHNNICLVASGHIGYDWVITSHAEGDNGNVVTQMLSDHQTTDDSNDGGLGIATMLYFMGDGKTVNIETISTVRAGINKDNEAAGVSTRHNTYFYNGNQYSIALPLNATKYDVVGDDAKTTLADLLAVVDEAVNGEGKVFADVNADGDVTLKDILRVAKYMVE